MVRIRDMEHGRCSQVHYGTRVDDDGLARLGAQLCDCPGFVTADPTHNGPVCKHCSHLRIQHNRPATVGSTPEVS